MDLYRASGIAIPQLRCGAFPSWSRRWAPWGSLVAALALILNASSFAQPADDLEDPEAEEQAVFLRIASGAVAGSYFRMADVIAGIISHPLGSGRCTDETRCGPRGLIAVAQASEGSVRNVVEINAAAVDTGLAQADVVLWARQGTRLFEKVGRQSELRAIARLYPETIHLVVRFDAPITSLSHLEGKRISIDRPGSGTNATARLVFEAVGVRPDDMDLQILSPSRASAALKSGDLDGFFYTAGAPVTLVTQLIETGEARLVPISGTPIDALRARHDGVFETIRLTDDLYPGQPAIDTLGVGALWVTHADLPDALVYAITRALWNEANTPILQEDHPLGGTLTPKNAVTGLPLPFHPGAERYYREAGLISDAPQTTVDPDWPAAIPRPVPKPKFIL